ncbi:conjugative transfer relaxase/helicase TraI [Serratia fonticola]|uniref:conjugative transfer relaxase/helicase TraI n=1 Tax=Serratia fonticola TaxID=47917 RepID=UPI0013772BE8|nr:conjugative transfer relaxase/helicase TraI [Serratia fonticola]NCG53664.1 conjugative transfer relaxase/helicase TraI [Serratia fonticola]
MMSFSQVRSSGGAADYYTNKDNYYVLGSMDERWFGEGAQALGLNGPIDKETFTAVLEGKLPDGSDLTRMSGNENKHRAGYDLTFSAPKSVSMMILLGGDKRLIEAHNRAVEGAMREIEKMASVRTMKDGKSETVLTGNLVVALFNHDTSRDQEPQIHTHAVTANVTQHEGKWQALSSDTVGKSGFSENVLANQIAAGQIYRHLLGQDTDAMGYQREVVGKHGMWEFKGMPVEVYSSRSHTIDEAVGPDASLKSRDIAALDTRKPKVAIDPEEKMVEWLKTLKEIDFDIQAYRSAADSRGRTLQVPQPAQLSGDTTVLANDAVGKAISQLSERQVQFTWSDLLSKTVSHLPAEPGVVDVARAGLDVAIEKHQLIPLDKEKGIFTSDIHLFDELSINSLSQEISRNGQVSVDAARSVPRKAPYSDAVSVLAQDKSPLAVLSGIGGASVQRERVTEVVAMAQEQGRTVQVLASDNKSQRYLSEDKRLDGLVIPGRNALKSDVAFTPNSTVIVDQAEKYTLKETVVLLDAALRNNVQLIMMDTEQRKGTGNALSVMKEAGVARYQYGKGQQVDVQVISEPDKAQRFGQLARDYAKAVQSGEESVVQVSGIRNQKELNQQVREALKESDVLGREETTIRVLTPVWLDSKSRSSRENYREGMVLERYDSEAKSRERFVIDRVTPRTHSLTLVNPEGKAQVMRLSQLDSSWSLYQSTLMSVAEGEKLRVLAREEQGKLKSGDVLRVGAVNEGHLVVQKQTEHGGLMDKPLKLATGTSPYTALKIAHNYVESPGGSVSDRATVFVATAKQELNTEILNKLARSGKQVSLYSALDTEKTTEKLAHHPYYRVVSEQVKMAAGTDELYEAVTQQRDRLHTPEQQAIHLAIPTLEGDRLAFSRIKLTGAALEFAEKGTQVADIQQEITRQEQQGELISVESAHGFGVDLLVSRNTFETEKSIIRHIAQGKDSLAPLMAPAIGDAPNALIPTQGLTEGQQKATELILTSRDRFVAIQGYAGVGKTTQFRAVLDALATLPREQQPRVVGLAPTHRAVGEMQSAGVQAQTLASFLHEEDRKLIAGETPDYRNTLFVLDEGSMVGNRDMARAYALIAAGDGRAVISGDVAQLQPISPGQPFKLQQGRSAIDMAVMKDIVRQTPQLREAVYKIIDNDLPGALAVIDSVPPQAVPRREGAWIPENSVLEWQEKAGESEILSPQPVLSGAEEPAKPRSLYDAIAQDYLGRTNEARDNTLIITHLNSDRRAINSLIHDERHARGELGSETTDIRVLTNTNIPDGELRRLQTWGKNTEAVALLDNTYYRIAAVDSDSQTVTLKDDEGQERLISPREAVREGVTLYKAEMLSVSAGDKMRFTKSDVERGFVANSVWQVNSVSGDSVTLSDGKQARTLQPGQSNEHRHIDLAYAITAHGAQGASETFEIALEGAEGSRKAMVEQASAYVALSRSKQHVQVYTDDKALWLSAMETAKGRSTAHDVLFASQDKDTGTAIRLMGNAKSLDDVALGRNLLKQNGLTGQTLGKYISPGKKYPQPHVALPAFDANGKPAGAWLGAITLTEGQGKVDIPSSGRVLGSDQAQFAALQASQNGETRLADTLSDGVRIASSWPQSGVIVRLKGEGLPFNPGAMTGGKVWVEDAAVNRVSVHQEGDNTLLALPETPEEKQQRELQERAEKVVGTEENRADKPKDISLSEEKLNEITQSVLNPNQGDRARIPSELLVPSEGSILSPDTRAAVQQVAQENLQRARLQQIEQGMVRDLVKEKTLGGD